MLKNIFLDLDDTILNFTAGEAKALSQTLREAGIEPTEAILDRYHIINTAHWELLEEGRLTRDEVLVQRFEQLFRELGVNHSGKAISERYEVLLSCQHDFMPGAEQLLKDLSSRYDLYLASNGAAAVQNPRLDDAGLRPYFKGIFISEEMGADKPSKAFFDACFAAIPCPTQADAWPEAERDRYRELVARCDMETMVSDTYSSTCMQRRDRYMVDHAMLLIAAFDGTAGGTRYTVEYALRRGIEIFDVSIPTE